MTAAKPLRDPADAPPQVHNTAIVDRTAELANGVTVGPWAIIEAHARVGRGTAIGPRAYIGPNTTVGENNVIYLGAIIGHDPQDREYRGHICYLRVGNDCIFREGAVIHRGAEEGATTVLGDRGFYMHYAHVGHDGVIGDDVTLGPNCLLAGHVTVMDGANLSGNTAVHQHCRVGRLAFMRGASAISVDLPPICIGDAHNALRGLNVVGMRRAGLSSEDRLAIQVAFQRLFRSRNSLGETCDELEIEARAAAEPLAPPVAELIVFIREARRGVVRFRDDDPHSDAAE